MSLYFLVKHVIMQKGVNSRKTDEFYMTDESKHVAWLHDRCTTIEIECYKQDRVKYADKKRIHCNNSAV